VGVEMVEMDVLNCCELNNMVLDLYAYMVELR
jgi:hypothetical protein